MHGKLAMCSAVIFYFWLAIAPANAQPSIDADRPITAILPPQNSIELLQNLKKCQDLQLISTPHLLDEDVLKRLTGARHIAVHAWPSSTTLNAVDLVPSVRNVEVDGFTRPSIAATVVIWDLRDGRKFTEFSLRFHESDKSLHYHAVTEIFGGDFVKAPSVPCMHCKNGTGEDWDYRVMSVQKLPSTTQTVRLTFRPNYTLKEAVIAGYDAASSSATD